MSFFGRLLRRHFEPVVLSVQVLVDLGVLLLACWLGVLLGERLGGIGPELRPGHVGGLYRELSALIAALCLVSFHFFGMYHPTKSLLNMAEFQAAVKAVIAGFFVLLTLLIYLYSSRADASGPVYEVLVPLHEIIDLDIDPRAVSRLTLLIIFGLILVLTIASRFVSYKVIQVLHRRGIGNRNILIYGAGSTGAKLKRKFVLVPTLGMNLVGFVDDDPTRRGTEIEHSQVLGGFEDLERLVGELKISEVFVAMPEAADEDVMRIIAECERLGVGYKVVPRFWHLMAFKVRIENLDSIPLISRPERRTSIVGSIAKRVLDLVVSSAILILSFPLLVIIPILIKRESKGPVFFMQQRIGRDGKPFRMFKFRTMHVHMSGDAPTPRSPYDPRITSIGRWLRRYSLDELPQFFNVILGDMSVVGPRPEMLFIVEKYTALDRERLRVKPGITGLWQISYARAAAIHENLDYDLYYIENQSFLLDVVIIALTGIAVVKGTGAY